MDGGSGLLLVERLGSGAELPTQSVGQPRLRRLSGWRAQGAQADGDAHRGRGSLRYDNADAAQPTFSQMLRVAPGQTIDFGVWLKTHGVRGQSATAALGVICRASCAGALWKAAIRQG